MTKQYYFVEGSKEGKEVLAALQNDCNQNDEKTLRGKLVHYLARRVQGFTLSYRLVVSIMNDFERRHSAEQESYVESVIYSKRQRKRLDKIRARRRIERDDD